MDSQVTSGARLALRVAHSCVDQPNYKMALRFIFLMWLKKDEDRKRKEENSALNFIPFKKKCFSK